MLVMNWMSHDPVTINPDESMFQAMRLLEKNHIRRLPVVKKNKLVGMVTERDIKAAYPSAATLLAANELPYLLDKVKVRELMQFDPTTIHVHDTVEEAAQVMMANKIGGLPVMDEGRLVGIITESDIFRALVSLSGVNLGGVQFALEVEDLPGSIKAPADTIRRYGGRIVSILTSYDQAPEGRRRVYIRTKQLDRSRLKLLQEDLSRVGQLIYVLDGRSGRKELFASADWIMSGGGSTDKRVAG